MSNTSDLIQASIILSIMEKYVFILIYISGFIGSLLNIFIFLQKRLRTIPCSTYFLANSIVDFSYINSFILIELISLFNLKIGVSIGSTNLWCKMGNYFYFFLPCLSSTYITFASIDRFCASSSNRILQKMNQLKISYILALIICLIWLLFSLHIPISYNRIRITPTSSIQCNPQLNVATVFIVIDGYFFALFNGIIVPILLILFGLLIFRNVKLLHRRTRPDSTLTTISNQRHLMTMLFFQVSLTIILYTPYVVLYLYGIYNSPPKDSLLLLLYEIFRYIAGWFWFMNFCKAFYVNILSSQTFRNIFKRRIIRLLIPTTGQQNAPHRSTPQTNPDQLHSNSNSESSENSN